jgi:hypothetical protein
VPKELLIRTTPGGVGYRQDHSGSYPIQPMRADDIVVFLLPTQRHREGSRNKTPARHRRQTGGLIDSHPPVTAREDIHLYRRVRLIGNGPINPHTLRNVRRIGVGVQAPPSKINDIFRRENLCDNVWS